MKVREVKCPACGHDQTGEAFLFALIISLVEKVKQRKEKTTSRKRQYQDT